MRFYQKSSKKAVTERPTVLYHDSESYLIYQLLDGPIPGMVKKVCTDENKEKISETTRSVIYKVKYIFRGSPVDIVVKEVEWEEEDFNKELDRLKQVHDYLGHGHKKGTKKRWFVMKYLGVAPSAANLKSDFVDYLVQEAVLELDADHNLERHLESITTDYTLKQLVSSTTGKVEWKAHGVGNWRNAKVLRPNLKPKVSPIKINNYQEW